MVDDYEKPAPRRRGASGDSRIVGAVFIREVHPATTSPSTAPPCSKNGTVCDGAHIGVDVKAYDFIAAENARSTTA